MKGPDGGWVFRTPDGFLWGWKYIAGMSFCVLMLLAATVLLIGVKPAIIGGLVFVGGLGFGYLKRTRRI